MELTQLEIEQFDNYLAGKMSSEEKLAFEKLLQSDIELKEKFEQYSAIVTAIKISGREAFKKKIAKEGAVHYLKNSWGKQWTLIFAAIFILFIAMFFVFENNLQDKFLPNKQNQETIVMEENVSTNENQRGEKSTDIDEKPVIQNESQSDSILLALEDSTDDDFDMDVETMSESEDIVESQLFKDTAFVSFSNDNKNLEKESMGSAVPPPTLAESNSKRVAEPEVVSGQLLLDTVLSAQVISQKDLDGESDSATISSEIKSVIVQFWKSPLNSRVYKYTQKSGKAFLEIYGIEPNTIQAVFYLNGEYLFLGNGVVYRFVANQSYLPLKLDRNKELIGTLERIK